MYRALTSASVLDPIGPNSGAPRPGIRSRSRRARGSQRGVPRRNGTGSLVPRPIPRVSATPQPRRSGRRPSDGTERAQDPGGSRTAHARSRPNSNGGEVVSASSRCTSNTEEFHRFWKVFHFLCFYCFCHVLPKQTHRLAYLLLRVAGEFGRFWTAVRFRQNWHRRQTGQRRYRTAP